MTQQQLQTRLAQAVRKIFLKLRYERRSLTISRSVNEALMLGTAEQRHAAAASAVAAAQQQAPTSGF